MGKAKIIHKILWRTIQATYGVKLKLNKSVEVNWINKPPKDSNYLLVANHSNTADPFMIGTSLRTPVNYMANVDGVRGVRKFFSSGIGCFNIRKGRPDIKSFMNAMQLLKNSYTVGIFPEGDRNWIGETEDFSTAISSMVAKIKVPVVMANFTGAYFSMPRWSPNIKRKGKVFIDVKTLSKEEICQMNKNEIHNEFKNFLYNDDFSNPKLKDVIFSGKNLALGIENLIWLCPNCGEQDTVFGKDSIIHCKSCNIEINIDGKQNLSDSDSVLKQLNISNVKDVDIIQKEYASKLIDNTDKQALIFDIDVEIFEEKSNFEWCSLGKGQLNLYKEKLVWDKENNNVVFEMKDVLNIVDNFNEYSLLNLKKDRYKIILNNTKHYKWKCFIDRLTLR